MKRILFIITSFKHGGTNRSLQNILSLIDTDNYKIDVFAMAHHGPYKEMLPNCNILPEDKLISAQIKNIKSTKGWERILSFSVKIWRVISSYFFKNLANVIYNANGLTKKLNKKEYDAIIAFSEGVVTNFSSRITHKNKIAWIHSDYANYMKLNNYPDERKLYESYRSIICVSEFTKKEFCKIIPNLQDRVYAIHNVVNGKEIQILSQEGIDDKRFNTSSFNIISVGRIDQVKRFDLTPKIAASIKEKGLKFSWYLIGPNGHEKAQALFESNIRTYDVDDCFFWLGEKNNPYPYIAKSKLLVITSKSEACPYVLNEAKILGIPVVSTDFGSAPEFIEDGVNGVITPLESIDKEINKFISNKEYYLHFKQNLQGFNYSNESIMNKFYSLI